MNVAIISESDIVVAMHNTQWHLLHIVRASNLTRGLIGESMVKQKGTLGCTEEATQLKTSQQYTQPTISH